MKGFVTVLALLMALLLTGCGNRETEAQMNQQNTDSQTSQSMPQEENDLVESPAEMNENAQYEADAQGEVDGKQEIDPNSISEGADQPEGSMAGDMQNAVDDAADAAKDVTDGVANGARDVVDGVVDGARDVTNDVIDGVDDMTQDARNGMQDAAKDSQTSR